MTQKEKCLKAINTLISDYESKKHNVLNCALCSIYLCSLEGEVCLIYKRCMGCPNRIFGIWTKEYMNTGGCNLRDPKHDAIEISIEKRGHGIQAKFWIQAKKYLETLPPKEFTNSGQTKKAMKPLLKIRDEIYK